MEETNLSPEILKQGYTGEFKDVVLFKGTKMGRPTEYKEEYISKVDEYLELHQDEEKQVVKQSSEKYEMYDNKLKVKLPTIEGFALFIGVNKTSLYEWEKKHEEFSNALEKIRQEQQQRLINNGLSGDYNPTIAKLILSSNHGMREKTETDLTSKGEKITWNEEKTYIKHND
jgi:hypothetical protein